MTRRNGLTAVGGVAAVLAAVAATGMRPAEPDDVAKLRQEVAELKAALTDHTSATTRTAEDVSRLSRTSPPVGAVAAFAGAWPPRRGDGGAWTEADLGWLLCDGRAWDHKSLTAIPEPQCKELACVLGGPGLPDYRGFFLRGVGQGSTRDTDRLLGTIQLGSTAMPHEVFKTEHAGDHTHQLSQIFNQGTDENKGGAELSTHNKFFTRLGAEEGMKKAGDHAHGVIGGDPETRPINVAVYWVVKFK